MSMFERTVLAELRQLRETEAALEGVYRSLGDASDNDSRFLVSLRRLAERVNRLENFLDDAA